MKKEELIDLRRRANAFHKQYLADKQNKEDERLMGLRSAFVNEYDEEFLSNGLTKENYSLGNSNKETFSYKIEFGLARLGSARGGSAEKFLVYYSNKRKKYDKTRHINKTVDKVFTYVKEDLLKIYKAAMADKIEDVASTRFWYIIKYKIYWTYNPDHDIPVFKKEHMNDIIKKWDISCKKGEVDKRKALYDFKINDPSLKKMTNVEFMRFIYSSYSGLYLKGEADDENDSLNIPENTRLEDFKGEYVSDPKLTSLIASKRTVVRKNVDYEKLNKKRRVLGLFGENLIMNDESSKLKALGLDGKVEHSSVEVGDGLGYDIRSLDQKGDELFIEVKTTKMNRTSGFYLSKREREFAEKNQKQYRLYRIYNLDMYNCTYKVAVYTYNDLLVSFNLVPTMWQAEAK